MKALKGRNIEAMADPTNAIQAGNICSPQECATSNKLNPSHSLHNSSSSSFSINHPLTILPPQFKPELK